MSDVHFHCVICGLKLSASSRFSGAVVECPACLRNVPVPALLTCPNGSAECAGVLPPEVLAIEVKFLCRGCRCKLRADVRWEGHEFPCPNCGAATRLPPWFQPAPLRAREADGLSPAEIAFLSAETEPAPRLSQLR